jgi:hypothetical protein
MKALVEGDESARMNKHEKRRITKYARHLDH